MDGSVVGHVSIMHTQYYHESGQFSMVVSLILIFVGLYLYNHIFPPIFVRVKSLKFLFVGATSCPLRFPHLLVALTGNQFLQPRHFANLCAPWLRQMPWKCQVLTEVSRGNFPKKMEPRARGKLMGTSPFRNLEIYIEIYGKSQFLIGMCWSMLIIYNGVFCIAMFNYQREEMERVWVHHPETGYVAVLFFPTSW